MTLAARQRGVHRGGFGRRAERRSLHPEVEPPSVHRLLSASRYHQPVGTEGVPGDYKDWRSVRLPIFGKMNVRFDEGELEIGPLLLRHFSTLPLSCERMKIIQEAF